MNNELYLPQYSGDFVFEHSKVSGNPLLSDTLGHLQPGSPCVDAADPSDQDARIPYGMGTVKADMGAYGGPMNWIWGGDPIPEDGSPVMDTVQDIPGDEGGFVGLQFQGSIFDYQSTAYNITNYSIWRELDINKGENLSFAQRPTGQYYESRSQYWEKIGETPAQGFQYYGYTAPTLGDSLAQGIFWSKFLIVAHTDDDNIYWESLPDSGYSVDNLAPAVPMELTGTVNNTAFHLQWTPVSNPDLNYYAIYRGFLNYFDPEPFVLTVDPQYDGISLNTLEFQYAVAAVDFTGNTSALSNAVTSPAYDALTVPEGWSGLSSWIVPTEPALEYLLAPLSPEVIILYNNNGMYWPGQNLNTLGDWNAQNGYVVKLAGEGQLPFIGNKNQNLLFETTPGWQILPVLSPCEVETQELQNQLGDQLLMAKEIAGCGVFWPAMGINTLGTLEPGKAYWLNTQTGAVNFTFPACNFKSGATAAAHRQASTTATLSKAYGFQVTPVTHTVAILPQALQELLPGDVVTACNGLGECAGATVIATKDTPAVLTLFGDDATTWQTENLSTGEAFTIKIYRPATGETFAAAAEYDQRFPNADGTFAGNGISAVKSLKLGAVSVGKLQATGIGIFPNPGNGIFHLTGVDAGTSYKIMKNNGELLTSGRTNAEGVINISTATPGVYYLQVITHEQVRIFKVVVK
jgi:hypothetical protein